jgi:hypothetical protein
VTRHLSRRLLITRASAVLLPVSLGLASVARLIAAVATPAARAGDTPTQPTEDAVAYENLLGLIPDTAETRELVMITELNRIRRQFGIATPEDASDPAQEQIFINALVAHVVPFGVVAPPFLTGIYRFGGITVHERYLGFRRLDQAILAGTSSLLYEAVSGRFDPEAAERAISECADCPPPVREQFEQVPYYSWGEDFEARLSRRLAPPAFDTLGRGGRVVVTEQYVFRTVWTEGIQQMIAAWRLGGSLRDSESFQQMAQGFARSNAYNLYITDRTQGPEMASRALASAREARDPDQLRMVEAAWSPPPGVAVLEPYILPGAGLGRDSAGEPFTAIVLVHTTEQAANDNVELLRRRVAEARSARADKPWSEVFSSAEIAAEGVVLVAALRGSLVGASFLLMRDPLLLHR